MAPFRGRRGGRGGRGGHNDRGGSAKLARSGIKTRAGYRKFDSQRVKEVEPEDSDDVSSEGGEDAGADLEGSSEDDMLEETPTIRAYNTLMQSFHQPAEQDGRKRKRRKVEIAEEDRQISPGGESEGEVEVQVEDDPEDEDRDTAANEEVAASEDEDEGNAQDPYEIHFASPDDNELSRRLKAVQSNEWRTEKQPIQSAGRLSVSVPQSVDAAVVHRKNIGSTTEMSLKKRLVVSSQKRLGRLSTLSQAVAPYIVNYSDLMLANRTPENAQSLRDLACLHALNHILKGRDKVIKNNARLSHAEDADLDARDQGFTRPKVLILLETRQMCAKYADSIAELFLPDQQENKDRFQSSFSSPIEDRETMPDDYNEVFEGNNDNNFLTGLKFTRKTMKFYSPFYTSDIIIASPLGLRRILENEEPKKRDYDFLSSIEIVIVDQADAMQTQNWENVESVFRHLNLQLKEAHGCDFSRVRPWYLDGHAKYLRQTIVFSAYMTPELNRLFNGSMLNIAGKAKLLANYAEGAIASVGGLGIKQTFSRLDSSSPAADPDARFKFFTATVLPSILRQPAPADGAKGILIFVPSYYDFLRLRNFFATSTLMQNTSFGAIHDYSDVSAQRRARSHLLSGRHSILLYTQRAHHFYRLKVKGVKKVVMYGVPDNSTFYEELVSGFLGTSLEEGRIAPEEASVRALFSKWDALKLERIVGSERVKGMLGGKGDTFDFL